MGTIGKLFLFGGFLLVLICQFYIVVRAFKYKFLSGVFCFIIPAYVLYYAMREETRQTKALIGWGAGLIISIVGVVILSF